MSCDLSVNFSQMWRLNQIPTQSVKVVKLQDLALMYELEDFLMGVDEPLRLEQDIDLFLATKAKHEIFHFAVTLVVKRAGVDFKDRYFDYQNIINIDELKKIPVSRDRFESPLDSLAGLLKLSYHRCHSLFPHLTQIENHKVYFMEITRIYTAVHKFLTRAKPNAVGHFHTKALLTTLNRQTTTRHVRKFFN